MNGDHSSSPHLRPATRRARVTIWMLGAGLLIVVIVGVGVSRTMRAKRQARSAAVRAEKKLAGKSYQRPAVPVVPRSGLPRLARKMRAGEPLTIAFLGGSITQNAGHGGFVSEVAAWIGRQAPGIQVETVNAGMAATGSDLGAQRITRDVLVRKPDVVFVEFAVNDSDRECTADMERIVRKIRLADPRTDIVFLYCVMDWTLPRLEQGKLPPSAKRHEAVAVHYDLPTVALGYEAARKIRLGEWTWANFSADACHPTPDGYASYNRDLGAALPQLIATSTLEARPLPPSLTPDFMLDPPPVVTPPPPTR